MSDVLWGSGWSPLLAGLVAAGEDGGRVLGGVGFRRRGRWRVVGVVRRRTAGEVSRGLEFRRGLVGG